MAATTTTNDAKFRSLLRLARRNAKLSQAEAAARAGVSRTWWRRVETAVEVTVTEETAADMAEAVGIQPAHLDAVGHTSLAELLRKRQEFDQQATEKRDDLEQYLMEAPVTDDIKLALVMTARALREIKRSEPFADQFLGRVKGGGST